MIIMQYDKIKTRPVQFLSITSLKVEDFNYLLPYFKVEWDYYNDCSPVEPDMSITNKKSDCLSMGFAITSVRKICMKPLLSFFICCFFS